jgi:hypothetical protein
MSGRELAGGQDGVWASRSAKSGEGKHRSKQVNTAQAQHSADHLTSQLL